MNDLKKEALKARLLRLASLQSTGAPAELALRLEISERHVKRIVKEIRDKGINIRYSAAIRSYVTEEKCIL
jgi:biotin operon repressor